MKKTVIVMLHGVGSNGADIGSLASLWRESLPDALFLSPNAPEQSDFGQGYQWFSLDGITPENRYSRVEHARQGLQHTLDHLFVEHNVDPSSSKIFLVGFSQGSIMSMDYLLCGKYSLAGVVAFSGRLATHAPESVSAHTPLCLIHGQADPVIDWHESEIAARTFSTLGYEVTTFWDAGVPHSISASGAVKALEFIQQQL